MKKETLEESTKNWITKNSGIKSLLTPEFIRESFKAGAKWQEDNSDKKYTEEDLHNLLRARRQLYSHTDENVLKVFINSLNKQD